jgi:hypothetical protein
MNKLMILMVLLAVTGCSNRAVYENIRIHQRNECLKELPSRYEECIEPPNKSFEEYQRERKEVLEQDSNGSES